MSTPSPLHPRTIHLPHQAIHTLPDAAGIPIECCSGSVWITLDDDPRDIVLGPGESFTAGSHRRALVSALSNARIRIAAPPQSAPCVPVADRCKASPGRLGRHGLSPA